MIQEKVRWVAADMAAEGTRSVDIATIFAVVETLYEVYKCLRTSKGGWRRVPILHRPLIRLAMKRMDPPIKDEALVDSLARLAFITTDEEIARGWAEIRLGQGGGDAGD